MRAASGSVIAGVIDDRLSRDDPQGVVLLRRYADRLDPSARHALGMAVSGAELRPMGENLRVRTAPGQRSATVQRRVDNGLFGTGIGAEWINQPIRAEWTYDE